MERLMRYKTLQCFLAALIMIAFLAPATYASGTPDAYEASANAVSEKYIGKTVPGACVVISEHDNTVFAKGYGFADLENNTAIDPETTVFEWGSISKTFVWVSVMQLVEDRKIDLETDIRTYLPDSFLKNLRFAEPVTLLHLMNHTAGFEEELMDLRYYSASEEIPFKEVLCSRCRNCSGHLRVFHGNQPCRKEKNQSTGPYDCFICIANYICVDDRILNSSINEQKTEEWIYGQKEKVDG